MGGGGGRGVTWRILHKGFYKGFTCRSCSTVVFSVAGLGGFVGVIGPGGSFSQGLYEGFGVWGLRVVSSEFSVQGADVSELQVLH